MIIRERIPQDGYVLIWTHDVPDSEGWRDSTGKPRNPTMTIIPLQAADSLTALQVFNESVNRAIRETVRESFGPHRGGMRPFPTL